ncbi:MULTISPECIES: hypothetical protein [Methanobrevibacter]|nr:MULTISPECIES: hypothetical protein [Methanobrevibacter]
MGTVWENQRNEKIKRSFNIDYESSVPEDFASDGKVYCYLYIAVES